MKFGKKALSVIICLIMVFGTVAISGNDFAEFINLMKIKVFAEDNSNYNKQFTVNFYYSKNGDLYKSFTLSYGSIISEVGVPQIDGKKFVGWDRVVPATMPDYDLDFYATWVSLNEYSVGDIIYYGNYPQTDVTDSLGSILNSQSGTWLSYNYYSGTGWADGHMTASDYMRYKDVTYNGNKYRGVTFDSYRPYATEITSSSFDTHQVDNGYTTGNVYWFKYDPVKWRVLDPASGLVMCNSAIDSQAYNNYILYADSICWGDSGKTYYANNYAKSSIRQWLNNDFYNTAFSDEQKLNIKTTTLNNYCYDTLVGNSEYEEYDAPSTNDKVFLLSYDQAINSGYGFNSQDAFDDTARRLQGSDYAKCQGLYVYNSRKSEFDGNSSWWLRSPGIESDDACYVQYVGNADNPLNNVSYTTNGVVPALELQILKSDISTDNIGSDETTIFLSKDVYEYNTGEEFAISGELYSPNGTNDITLEWTLSDSDGLSLNLPASMQNTDANHIIFSVLATGTEEGNYTITVTTSNGASSTRKVVISAIHAEGFDPESTSGIYQINGRLINYGVTTNTTTGHSYVGTVNINDKWYNVKKDILNENKASQLKGKNVICNFDENTKEIIAISKCREISDLQLIDIANIKGCKRVNVTIANEYRWVHGKVYKYGGTMPVVTIPFQMTIYNSIPSEYFDLSESCKKDSAFNLEISDLKVNGISNCGGIKIYNNSFPTTVRLGESVCLNGEIFLPADFWLGYEDNEKIISAVYEIIFSSGNKTGGTIQTVVTNKDPKVVTENKNTKLTDAANKLKRTPTNAISLNGLSEIGFKQEQIKYIEKLVLVELSLYTIPGESLEEYVNKKIMEKIFGAKSDVGIKNGKLTIVIPTRYQDRNIQVDIVCDITNYTLMKRTFGSFTNITYHAYNLKKNGKREKYAFKENGFAGLAVSANVEEFAKAATDIAMEEIKSASKTALNGYEEVERIIFGDTALQILNAAGYKSVLDLGWKLYVNACKELTYKCPVDIYVYDKDGVLCGAIVNDVVTLDNSDDVDLDVQNAEKIVTLWEDGYYVKTLSNCAGTLNITIKEKSYINGNIRTLTFENLPLEIGTIYKQGCGTDYYDDSEAYAVELLNGETIQATTDTLCMEALAQYTATYNANGGDVTVSSETVHEGEYVILPTSTREGYSFLGWSMDNDNTSDYDSGSALEMTDNVTLYAVWQKNENPDNPGNPDNPYHTNPTLNAKLKVPSNVEVEYASTVTITAKATEVPQGYYVALYDGNTLLKKGNNTEVSYTFPGEFKEAKNITVKIIDDDENVQKDGNDKELSASFEVKAKSGFFAKLIAFFKRLFKTLPKVTVEPK